MRSSVPSAPMPQRLTACAALLLGGLLASPALAGPITGIWAYEPGGTCDRTAPTDLVPILIEEGAVRFYESSCDIVEAEPVGVGNALSLRLACSGEGQTWASTALILVDAEDRLFLYWEEGGMFIGRRCE